MSAFMEMAQDGEWLRVLLLRDYNTRVVMAGTLLLGLASGVIGTFLLLRKRALLGDAVSHATLPGIAIAFMIMVAFGGLGKQLEGLLLGGLVAGLAGMGCVLLIRRYTRLKEDAALGIVLSVFFGLGIALLGIIQRMESGHAAGLESFIYGKTAAMLARDAQWIAGCALVILLAGAALYKEFSLLCFDEEYAGSQGWPVVWLDVVMLGLVVVTTVIGLQAVGLILMIALLIIPPAAARFWTNRLRSMLLISGGMGAFSGFAGALISASFPRLPAGAIIVTVAGAVFLFSMAFGSARGVLYRAVDHVRVKRNTVREHLLRAVYEHHERHQPEWTPREASALVDVPVSLDEIMGARSWTPRSFRRVVRSLQRAHRIRLDDRNALRLTTDGLREAQRIVRNHRLWEMYLIRHADIAPGHVDRNADRIEHVLGPELVHELEELLKADTERRNVPPSPHALS